MLTFNRHRATDMKAMTSYIILCAWCKQQQRYDKAWGPRTVRDDEPNLSHGICPECFEREREKLALAEQRPRHI
jgi:hypothetical protein